MSPSGCQGHAGGGHRWHRTYHSLYVALKPFFFEVFLYFRSPCVDLCRSLWGLMPPLSPPGPPSAHSGASGWLLAVLVCMWFCFVIWPGLCYTDTPHEFELWRLLQSFYNMAACKTQVKSPNNEYGGLPCWELQLVLDSTHLGGA